MTTARSARADVRSVLGLDAAFDALDSSASFRGPVEPLDGHPSNDHLALVYERLDQRLEAVAPFLREGIERGERCLYVGDETSEETIAAALRDAGVDVDDARESGALVFRTVDETYLRDERFDPEGMTEFYADVIEDTTDEYEGLRVAAETEWLRDETTDVEAFMEYESAINDLFEETDCIAMCQYDRRLIPPEVLEDVVRTHPHVVYEGTVCHNDYYTPPEEFTGPTAPDREVERMLETLRGRTEARVALAERERDLEELYRVASATDLTFGAKLDRLLELGTDRFGLDVGLLTRLEDDAFEVVDAVGDAGPFEPGTTIPRESTYCRKLLGGESPMAVTDAPAEGWADDPAFETYDLDSYLGATVTIGTETFGTLCFCSREARDRPFTDAERTFAELLSQWISYELERERSEARLAALNEMSRDLMTDDSPAAIAATAAEHAAGSLDLPLTAVLRYDPDAGDLVPSAQTPRAADELPLATLCDRDGGPLWEAFVERSERVLDDVAATDGAGADLTAVAAVPISTDGLLVVGTTVTDGFCPAERDFVEATAATVTDAWLRADRERELQHREETLEEQNETLQRMNRVNDIIRSIDQALVQAASRDEIEAVVCEHLADRGPYELAWLGEPDPVTDEIVPRAVAGAEKGYLDAVSVSVDEGPTGIGPAGRAIRRREPQVANDIVSDDRFAEWRQAALSRGYQSSIALPLVYEDRLYGVLNVYAGQPRVFEELERSVLTELSDTIAYAINAVENKKALVNDAATELVFALDDDAGIVSLTGELGGSFAVENVTPDADGRLRGFFTTEGIPAEAILDRTDDLPIRSLSLVFERDRAGTSVCLFEGTLTEESVAATAVEHNGRLEQFTATDGSGTATVSLRATEDVRKFTDVFQTRFPDAELRAQRSGDDAARGAGEVRATLTDELTDRQREVFRTAYFNGYFERPRPRTGSEIATELGITQPTFNAHLRAAQRKLCGELFGDVAALHGDG